MARRRDPLPPSGERGRQVLDGWHRLRWSILAVDPVARENAREQALAELSDVERQWVLDLEANRIPWPAGVLLRDLVERRWGPVVVGEEATNSSTRSGHEGTVSGQLLGFAAMASDDVRPATREEAAHHEAGHAIAAAALGWVFYREGSGINHLIAEWTGYTDVEPVWPGQWERLTVVLAGGAGEARFLGSPTEFPAGCMYEWKDALRGRADRR